MHKYAYMEKDKPKNIYADKTLCYYALNVCIKYIKYIKQYPHTEYVHVCMQGYRGKEEDFF